MTTISSSEFECLCRVCTKHMSEAKNIFTTIYQTKSLAEMLRICSRQHIEESDGLPANVCSACALSLISSYEFFELTTTSDGMFRQVLLQESSKQVMTERTHETMDQVVIGIDAVNRFNKHTKIESLSSMHPTTVNDTDLKLASIKGRKVYECVECKQTFDRLSRLREHLQHHPIDNSLTGSHKLLKSETDQYPGIGGVTDSKPLSKPKVKKSQVFPCEYCSRVYNTIKGMVKHAKKHENLNTYQCSKCTRSYIVRIQLEHHLETKHKKPGDHVCVCGKRFSKACLLRVHSRIHTGETREL